MKKKDDDDDDVDHETDNYTSYKWCSSHSHQRINKRTGGLGNKKMSGDRPNYCSTEISQNTEKSPRALMGLPVTQTPVKDHHADVKNSEGVIINETLNLLWDFDIETGPLIPARRQELVLINKKEELPVV